MITVYGGKPMFGLPNPSPFVIKTYILLKMAKLPYAIAEANFRKAPKGKIPYIADDGQILGDSHFIQKHIETKYGHDFDAGHAAEALAIATAMERLCEERLYWIIVYERWAIDAIFNKGTARFFDVAPAPFRPIVRSLIRRKVLKALWSQGISRHSQSEILELARTDLRALSVFLGDKTWLLGDTTCGADAALLAILMSGLCPEFGSEHREEFLRFDNLVAYEKRGRARFFQDV